VSSDDPNPSDPDNAPPAVQRVIESLALAVSQGGMADQVRGDPIGTLQAHGVFGILASAAEELPTIDRATLAEHLVADLVESERINRPDSWAVDDGAMARAATRRMVEQLLGPVVIEDSEDR
jgi:hypothetical protein